MVCRQRLSEIVWLVCMVVAAVIVGNGRTMCSALDMEVADASKEAVCPKIYENEIFSGKCMDNQDNKEGVQNLLDETKDISSDVKKYSSSNVKEIYNEAKRKVEEAYEFAPKNGYSQEAKTKYEAAKEKASDAVGQVGAKMRH